MAPYYLHIIFRPLLLNEAMGDVLVLVQSQNAVIDNLLSCFLVF